MAEPLDLEGADAWLYDASKAEYMAVFRQMLDSPSRQAWISKNPHLTSADRAGLYQQDIIFPADKPLFSTYALTKGRSFYSQVRPRSTGAPKIYCHRVALAYNLKFILNLAGDDLKVALKTKEASHLMNNYIGHQRDFNPNNIVGESGAVNKSRDACAMRRALRQAREANPASNFSLEDFYFAYEARHHATDDPIFFSQALSQEQTSQTNSIVSAINIGASPGGGAGPSTVPSAQVKTFKRKGPEDHDCCGEIHKPICKKWDSSWGPIPAWVSER
jgi:hypothetical protein